MSGKIRNTATNSWVMNAEQERIEMDLLVLRKSMRSASGSRHWN